MSGDAPLAVHGLTVAYGRRVALEDVTFETPPGALVGVIGPNGAGKSTLFKAILGVLRPTAGDVRLAERPSYVPQSDEARLDFPVTALDVALMGRYRSVPWWRPLPRAARRAARSALAQVGLEDLADRGIGELSGGQLQRVLLARALAQDSPIMLLDEPLSAVDAASQAAIAEVLRRRRAAGDTILLASHDLASMSALCDRVLVLNRRLLVDGPPETALAATTLLAAYGPGALHPVLGPPAPAGSTSAT